MIRDLATYTDSDLRDHLMALRARLGRPVDGLDDDQRRAARAAIRQCLRLPVKAQRRMIGKALAHLDDASRPLLLELLDDVGVPR